MLTARADVNDRLKALRLGVDDYITKPFEADELLVRIENLLQNAIERRKWSAPEETVIEEQVTEDSQLSKHDSEWLEQLTQIIEERLKDYQFRMEDLANELAISRRQLFRKTKEVTGLTPKQLLTEARLQRARQLLETKEVSSIKEVTYEPGFQTPSHFSDLFKKRFGKKPSDLLNS
jgi:AraC-like DNA-binding protein